MVDDLLLVERIHGGDMIDNFDFFLHDDVMDVGSRVG